MSDSEEETIEKQLKIAFLGENSVGKTSVIRRYCHEEFMRQYTPTVGADFYIKHVNFPGYNCNISLKIVDVGGQGLKANMLDKYLFNCNIVVLVYDITNVISFESMEVWIETIKKITDAPINAIFGNKCDLEHQRAVRLDRTQQFVKEYNIPNYLMSARTGEMVTSNITSLVAKYLEIPLTTKQQEHQQTVIKAELIPSPPEPTRSTKTRSHSTICSIQ